MMFDRAMKRFATDRTFSRPKQIPVVVLSMGVEWENPPRRSRRVWSSRWLGAATAKV